MVNASSPLSPTRVGAARAVKAKPSAAIDTPRTGAASGAGAVAASVVGVWAVWSAEVVQSLATRSGTTAPAAMKAATKTATRPAPYRANRVAVFTIVLLAHVTGKIGRESCRERVCQYGEISVVART